MGGNCPSGSATALPRGGQILPVGSPFKSQIFNDWSQKDMRTRHFKMMLTDTEYEQLKGMAGDQRISSADLVRHLVLGAGAARRMPSGATLRDIACKLSSISSNLNRCTKEIHSAKLKGTLTEAQFAALHTAIMVGLKGWQEPRNALRLQLCHFRGNR